MFKPLNFIKVITLSFVSLSAFAEESFIPDPPSVNATNYILMDSISGRALGRRWSWRELGRGRG